MKMRLLRNLSYKGSKYFIKIEKKALYRGLF